MTGQGSTPYVYVEWATSPTLVCGSTYGFAKVESIGLNQQITAIVKKVGTNGFTAYVNGVDVATVNFNLSYPINEVQWSGEDWDLDNVADFYDMDGSGYSVNGANANFPYWFVDPGTCGTSCGQPSTDNPFEMKCEGNINYPCGTAEIWLPSLAPSLYDISMGNTPGAKPSVVNPLIKTGHYIGSDLVSPSTQ